MAELEEDWEHTLYKRWNRMASGRYCPPPVRRVELPTGEGSGTRPLGMPTVSDRVAQAVVKAYLEPELERHFHPDASGYRPGKSALAAVGVARQRCWRDDWVLDLDIRRDFDRMDHTLLMRAGRQHTDCRWVWLDLARWLNAPGPFADGTRESREQGTPQGSGGSPLVAHLFLHYACDLWRQRHDPHIPCARLADEAMCQCAREAQEVRTALARRFADWGVARHPQKTTIVYCKDDDRRGTYPEEHFDFLGYTFRPRRSKHRWGTYVSNFSPGVSNAAAKAIRHAIRPWQLRCRVDKQLDDLARMFKPIIRGWLTYDTGDDKSALYPTLQHLDRQVARWAMAQDNRLRRHRRRAEPWLRRVARRPPGLCAHGRLLQAGAER